MHIHKITCGANGFGIHLHSVWWFLLALSLAPDTIVLQLAFAKDRDGVFLSQREANRLVNDNSAGPVYTLWEVRMAYQVYECESGELAAVLITDTCNQEKVEKNM